jgi:hypothetical protein
MADDLKPGELHDFKELMSDWADVVGDQWYVNAFEELQAQGHLSSASGMTMGQNAHARLSADGRLFLRENPDRGR